MTWNFFFYFAHLVITTPCTVYNLARKRKKKCNKGLLSEEEQRYHLNACYKNLTKFECLKRFQHWINNMQMQLFLPPLPKIKAALFMFKVNRYLSKAVYLSVHEDSLIIINVFQTIKLCLSNTITSLLCHLVVNQFKFSD